MNLQELIAKGESDTIEFKESFDKETLETSAAFANTKGESLSALVQLEENLLHFEGTIKKRKGHQTGINGAEWFAKERIDSYCYGF